MSDQLGATCYVPGKVCALWLRYQVICYKQFLLGLRQVLWCPHRQMTCDTGMASMPHVCYELIGVTPS